MDYAKDPAFAGQKNGFFMSKNSRLKTCGCENPVDLLRADDGGVRAHRSEQRALAVVRRVFKRSLGEAMVAAPPGGGPVAPDLARDGAGDPPARAGAGERLGQRDDRRVPLPQRIGRSRVGGFVEPPGERRVRRVAAGFELRRRPPQRVDAPAGRKVEGEGRRKGVASRRSVNYRSIGSRPPKSRRPRAPEPTPRLAMRGSSALRGI